MWLIIASASYLINAGVYIADKFLLSKKIHSSVVYAFFVGIWSIGNFVLLPFAFWVPNLEQMGLDLLAGFLFLITLIFWYKALHQSEATRVVPVVGGLVPIFSFILSWMFLGEALSQQEFLAFIVLISGGVLISIKRTKIRLIKQAYYRCREVVGKVFGYIPAQARPTQRLLINSFISAFLFALYYVLIKYIYNNQPFIGSFVWSRLGTFIGVLMILLVPTWRKEINEHRHSKQPTNNLFFFLVVRFLAAAAFIMLNWAISLGNVAMVNALQGVQYLFLLLIVIVLSKKFPKILSEEMSKEILIQKLIGVVLVSTGLYLLMI